MNASQRRKTKTIAILGHNESAFNACLNLISVRVRHKNQEIRGFLNKITLCGNETVSKGVFDGTLTVHEDDGDLVVNEKFALSYMKMYEEALIGIILKHIPHDAETITLLTGLRGCADTWPLNGFINPVRMDNVKVHCVIADESEIERFSDCERYVWENADITTVCGCSADELNQRLLDLSDEVIAIHFGNAAIFQLLNNTKTVHSYSPVYVLCDHMDYLVNTALRQLSQAIVIENVLIQGMINLISP